jgi:hypothetical protein
LFTKYQPRHRAGATFATELPRAGKRGKPTTRRSAPRATQASSSTGRAPVAGSATPGTDPWATGETRPQVAHGLTRTPARPWLHHPDAVARARAAVAAKPRTCGATWVSGAGRTFVCVADAHPTSPASHWYVRGERAGRLGC